MAVDDASTELSSLRHIVRLAPDVIKLDASLTRDIASTQTRQTLFSSFLSFAIDHGATVVAKGVETGRELDALRRIGVHQAQGYYLAPPSRIPEGRSAWGRTILGEPPGSRGGAMPGSLVGAAQCMETTHINPSPSS